MYKIAACGGVSFALLENRKLITHARIPKLADAQAHVDDSRKSQRPQILTLRLRGECHYGTGGDVETAFRDQVLIDGGVEEGVVESIVDVPVDIVVHPPSSQGQKVGIFRS